MTFSSAIAVPLWVVIHLCSTRGSLREVRVRLNRRLLRRARLNGFCGDFARSSVWLLAAARLKIQAGWRKRWRWTEPTSSWWHLQERLEAKPAELVQADVKRPEFWSAAPPSPHLACSCLVAPCIVLLRALLRCHNIEPEAKPASWTLKFRCSARVANCAE